MSGENEKMKILIDRHGNLHIKRGGRFKDQYCPYFTTNEGPSPCGDWCPHFREPKTESIPQYGGVGQPDFYKNLELCHNTILHVPEKDFTDERETQKGKMQEAVGKLGKLDYEPPQSPPHGKKYKD